MPDPFNDSYAPIGDEQAFSRAPMRAPMWRALEENAMHLYGTRVRQLVSHTNIYFQVPWAAASTWPVYLVDMTEGATRLWGQALYIHNRSSPQGGQFDITTTFYSERGEAAAAGLDAVTATSQVTTEAFRNQNRGPAADAFDLPIILDRPGALTPMSRVRSYTWLSDWVVWNPNLTTTRSQRVSVYSQQTRFFVSSDAVHLWGVNIYEEVPQLG